MFRLQLGRPQLTVKLSEFSNTQNESVPAAPTTQPRQASHALNRQGQKERYGKLKLVD